MSPTKTQVVDAALNPPALVFIHLSQVNTGDRGFNCIERSACLAPVLVLTMTLASLLCNANKARKTELSDGEKFLLWVTCSGNSRTTTPRYRPGLSLSANVCLTPIFETHYKSLFNQHITSCVWVRTA